MLTHIHPSGNVTYSTTNRTPRGRRLTPSERAFIEDKHRPTKDDLNGLVYPHESDDKPQKRRRLGITSKGKQRTRDGVAVLEQVYGRDRLAFVTLTYPPEYDYLHTPQDHARCLKLFNQRLVYKQESLSLVPLYTGVTEIHPERSKEANADIPHIHMVVLTAKRPYKWLITKDWIREAWEDVVKEVYGHIDTEFTASTRIESPRKCLSMYLSKYLSKEYVTSDKPTEYRRLELPQWWFQSRILTKMIEKRKITLEGKKGDILIYVARNNLQDYVEYKHFITDTDGRDVHVGGSIYPRSAKAAKDILTTARHLSDMDFSIPNRNY